MPLLSILAPGSRVRAEGLSLPGLTVERVTVTAGVNPVRYACRWRDEGVFRTVEFRADQLELVEDDAPPPVPQRGNLSDLGSLFAQQRATDA